LQELICNNGKGLCEETAKLSESSAEIYQRHPTGRKKEGRKEGREEGREGGNNLLSFAKPA